MLGAFALGICRRGRSGSSVVSGVGGPPTHDAQTAPELPLTVPQAPAGRGARDHAPADNA